MGSWAHHVQESFKNTLGVSASFDVHYYDEDVSESNTRNQNGPRGSFRHSIRKSFRLVPGQQQLSCGPPRLYTQPQASTRVRSEVMRVLNLAVTDPFRSGSGWLMWSWFFTTLFLLHTASALGLAWYLIFTPTFACYPRRTRLLWGSYQIFKVTCSVTNWITASILRRRTRMAALCRSQVRVWNWIRRGGFMPSRLSGLLCAMGSVHRTGTGHTHRHTDSAKVATMSFRHQKRTWNAKAQWWHDQILSGVV